MTEAKQETLEEFRQSLMYGSRTDLLFKFIASEGYTDGDAAEFLSGLMRELGVAFDTVDYERVKQYVFEWQVGGYAPRGENGEGADRYNYDSSPWTPLKKPLSESRVTLVSAGGVFVEGDDPLGPDGESQEEAIEHIADYFRRAPTLSVIPSDVDRARLRVRHPGYDIRGAQRDHNVVFPIDRLKELHEEGVIGELSEETYSFVGAAPQRRLLGESAPVWAEQLNEQKIDAALLVAA